MFLRIRCHASSHLVCSSPASSWPSKCVCVRAVEVTRPALPQICQPNRCAASSTSCTCTRWPRWFCMFFCCHSGTAAGYVGCGSYRWHTANPGRYSCDDPRTSCCRCRRSSFEAFEPGDTLQHKPVLWWGWCWCSGRQRCTWWISAPGIQSGFDLNK